MILGLMSSGLLPRVCASWVPGQSKTHGHSGFENDVEDLVTDLPAAFVANDVPAAFHVPEVFVDAAMIASDYWVSLFGAALSALFDAMLCLQTDDLGVSSLMNVYGFWERFLVSSGMLRIISHSGPFRLVPSRGFMAVRVLGVFAETGGCCSCDFGVLAELNGGCCSGFVGVIAELNGCCYCVPGHSQAADLLRSGRCCHSSHDTHFSALLLGLLPVHTITSDGALGFAGPLEHVAAAASELSGHSDLLVTSAAKETEYMLKTAAASAAAVVDHVLNTLLFESEAFACGYTFYKNGSHAAAATAAAYLFENPSVATVLHMSEWCWFAAGFWVGWCILLWNICQVHLEKDMPTFFGKGKKQGCTSKGSQETCSFTVLQALTQADSGVTRGFVDVADSEDECVSLKGKDGHDTDGSLSLGKGKASGRVDVPVGVNTFLSAEKLCRSEQSVALVSPGSCVVKTIFVKGVDGNTVVHRVHEHTVVGDLLDFTEDVWVTYNGKLVHSGDTIGHIGIGNHDTLRCGGRLRGGAQRYRSQPVDIPGQWTCQACGQERVWPVKTRCFRCGCPKGHVPLQPEPFQVGPLGRPPQRTAPTNPTFRPQRQNPRPVPPNGATNFPPLNQPSSVGQVDAAASGTVPAFPAGNLDWLVAFLRQIMSPEDYEKYKSSFDPTPAKEEVPLAVQLANKTKERGTVMGRIEHYRNVCRDLEIKLMRQGELLDENIARKATLQDEINELEARIAEEESGPPPAAPPGPPPQLQEVFPPPPEEEIDEDTQMESEAPDTGAGVGAFALPSKKKVIKSTFRKRASLRLTESRSSVFAKLSKLSPQELLRLSEQCTALAKDRDPDLGMDESALPATEEDDLQGTQFG